MKDDVLNCPCCQGETIKNKEKKEELETYGKVVINCKHCNQLFIWRDDGDGEFVYTTF